MTNVEKRSRTAETFTRALLAGTCLAASGGAASAGTLIEGVNSGDFGNTLGGATVTDASTTFVDGSVVNPTDPNDYIKFANLLPGSAFSLVYDAEASGTELAFDVLDSAGAAIHQFSPAAGP